jgi:hypothetical protein
MILSRLREPTQIQVMVPRLFLQCRIIRGFGAYFAHGRFTGLVYFAVGTEMDVKVHRILNNLMHKFYFETLLCLVKC